MHLEILNYICLDFSKIMDDPDILCTYTKLSVFIEHFHGDIWISAILNLSF